ncbi:MAG: hypothetical protein M0C28_18735 [Candidatus Moduliflexus flocculans]|nr:hypothetical protein [Candidatus Moduliflexus flocculans]
MQAYENACFGTPPTTRSPDHHSTSYPSTAKQLILLEALRRRAARLRPRARDGCRYGYVVGTLPGNAEAARSDGRADRPRRHLAGCLRRRTSKPASSSVTTASRSSSTPGRTSVLDPAVFPWLKDNVGHDLIVTDGSTLLGADDKAGVADHHDGRRTTRSPTRAIPPGHGQHRLHPRRGSRTGDDASRRRSAIGADFGYTLDGSARRRDRLRELQRRRRSPPP